MSVRTLTTIGVYGLADTYGIDGLCACALDQIPSPLSCTSISPFVVNASTPEDIYKVIDAHNDQCVNSNYAMGRKLCLIIIRWMPNIVKHGAFIDLAKTHTSLAADMYFAGCENGGKLW
jgi:hypothetical protein